MTQWVSIQEIAEVNPKLPKTLIEKPHRAVTFLPMAGVSEAGRVSTPEEAQLKDVFKGYRYFEEGDTLLAKITPYMENGKATVVPPKIRTGLKERKLESNRGKEYGE